MPETRGFLVQARLSETTQSMPCTKRNSTEKCRFDAKVEKVR